MGQRVNAARKVWPMYVMLLPAIIFLLIFCYYPMYGAVIAFQKYRPATGFQSAWVGLDNFAYLFKMPAFTRTILNTVIIAAWKIALGILVPVTFALMLNEIANPAVKRVFQTVIYVPNFLSWVIVSGIFVEILSGSDGIVNVIIKNLGGQPVYFLGDNRWFRFTLIVTAVWKTFGFGTVVYMAALTGIDPGLYESAIIDGANRFKQTLHVTLPGIAPIIVLMSILSVGNILNADFEQVYNMYSPIVYETGDIIDTFVYRVGFENAQYSVATATGLFKSVISTVLISSAYFLADRVANYRVF